MATQVVLLGNVPEPFDSVQGLVQWQEAHRRKLLQSKRLNARVCLEYVHACFVFELLQSPATLTMGLFLFQWCWAHMHHKSSCCIAILLAVKWVQTFTMLDSTNCSSAVIPEQVQRLVCLSWQVS